MNQNPSMQPAAPSPEKTAYTEQWEKKEMEKLYKKFVALIGPLDQPLVRKLAERVNEHFKDRKEISMLEIGAGGGRGTASILDWIANDRKILYTGIDVSEAQKNNFQENKDLSGAGLAIEDYSLSSWEDYKPKHPYDLILAQHSWYGIGKEAQYVKKMMDATENNGMDCVILSGNETISLQAWKAQGESFFGAEDFEKMLTDAGISFEKIEDADASFTREDFVKDGKLTQKGIDLCGYLYKKELKGDESDVIKMLEQAPDRAFKYPKFLFIIKK